MPNQMQNELQTTNSTQLPIACDHVVLAELTVQDQPSTARKRHRFFWCLVLFLLLAPMALATATLQATTPTAYSSSIPGDIAKSLDTHAQAWIGTIFIYAKSLFGILLAIDLIVTAMQAALGGGTSELKEWGRIVVFWILQRGFWAAVLTYGTTWVPSIIASFQQIGYTAAGISAPVSPGSVFNMGMDMAGNLLNSAVAAAWFTDPGSTLILDIGALLIMAAFSVMTLTLLVATVESYMCLSVGYIFLGFGGSRWTEQHARNYINLAIGIGTKLMLIYAVIQLATTMVTGWQAEMKTIDKSGTPLYTALDVMFGSVLLALCAWLIPKAFQAILTGTLSGHHGDAMAPVLTIAGAAAMGANMAMRGAGVVSSVVSKVSGGAAAGGTASRGGGGPSRSSPRGGGGGSNHRVPPPSR